MDILKEIPEEHILARTRDSNYPIKPDVEYPSATYPPLEDYRLGPEDYCWIKLEDEYVYVPRAYTPNRNRPWYDITPQKEYLRDLSTFLPGHPLPEVEGKFVSTKGEPIPYRVCFGSYDSIKDRCMPLDKIEKVVFKTKTVATVVMTPEPHLLLEGVVSKIIRIVPTSKEPVHFCYCRKRKTGLSGKIQHFVVNGENDPNLVPLEGDLPYQKYYDWEPVKIVDLTQEGRVYISVKHKNFIDLLNETTTWIESASEPAILLETMREILRRGVADKVIPWLREFSPLDGDLIRVEETWSSEPPNFSVKFPTVNRLRVNVPYSAFPHIMCKLDAKRIWVCYLDPKLTNNPEFLLKRLLLKPEEKCATGIGLAAHLFTILVWLRVRRAPLELALGAWEELIQLLDPEQPEHFRMQNIITFEKVWKELT